MYEAFAKAGKGLKTMFIGEIVSLIGAILIWIPVVGAVVNVVGSVMVVYGLYISIPAHPLFKNAMYLAIVGVVLGLIGVGVNSGFLGGLLSIARGIVDLVRVYFICTAAGDLLTQKGAAGEAARAEKVKKLYLYCTAISVICTLVSWIPIINVLAGIVGAVAAIINVVAYILLLVLYKKGSNALLA